MEVYIKDYGYQVSTTDRSQDGVHPQLSMVVVDHKVKARFTGATAPARAEELARQVAAQRKQAEDRAHASIFSLLSFKS